MALCQRQYRNQPTHYAGPHAKQVTHKKLQAQDVQCTLGVYLTPDGNNKVQIKILLEKTKTWADNARTGHLNKVATWLNLTLTILWQVHYVLPATTLTQNQCDKVMAPCLR